jgi:hypothetical protein
MILLVSFFLSGCPVLHQTHLKKPDWLDRHDFIISKDSETYFCGVGFAHKHKMMNEKMQKQRATNRAGGSVYKIVLSFVYLLAASYEKTRPTDFLDILKKEEGPEAPPGRLHHPIYFENIKSGLVFEHWADPEDGTMYALAKIDAKTVVKALLSKPNIDNKFKEYIKVEADNVLQMLVNEQKEQSK